MAWPGMGAGASLTKTHIRIWREAVAKAEANGINLAVSSPCIELWFVLHFDDQTAYIERQQAQSRARELLGCEKGLTNDALDTLAQRYDGARTRAIALDEKHTGDGSPPRSNPSSEGKLVPTGSEQTPNCIAAPALPSAQRRSYRPSIR